MLKRTIGLVVVLGIAAAAIGSYCPGLRTKMTQAWNSQTGWTEEARRADPVGFVTHAEKKMKQDLTVMQKTRRELAAEVGSLARKAREQTALSDQAQTLADEFRAAYQSAQADDSFPIEVRGEAYTEAQVRSQVSLLLAEAEGYGQSLGDIESVQTEAEERMEELAVRISKTESQMATLSTKRELLRVRKLTSDGEEVLAQVNELMTGNTQAIADNPVRTVRELAAAGQVKPTGRATDGKVEDFLAAKPSVRPLFVEEDVEATELEVSPASFERPSSGQSERQGKVKPAKKQKPKRSKPIFQQS